MKHTDLHCHSITSAPFESFVELSPGIQPPPKKFPSFDAFTTYLRQNVTPAISDIDSVRHITRAAFKRLIEEGVCYTEMSFDLTVPECIGSNFEEYFEMIDEERKKVAQSILICLEIGLDREIDPERLIVLFKKALSLNIFGSVDLYGDERAGPIRDFIGIYKLAAEHGLKRKAHVGEFGSAQSVKIAVETLDLQAVQHGIQAARSQKVMEFLAKRKIPLNVCPQSNLALGLISNIRNHPIRRLLAAGIPVTVNSDDYSIFRKSVSDQLTDLRIAGVCSEKEIAQIIDNGLKQIPNDQ